MWKHFKSRVQSGGMWNIMIIRKTKNWIRKRALRFLMSRYTQVCSYISASIARVCAKKVIHNHNGQTKRSREHFPLSEEYKCFGCHGDRWSMFQSASCWRIPSLAVEAFGWPQPQSCCLMNDLATDTIDWCQLFITSILLIIKYQRVMRHSPTTHTRPQ